MKRLSAKAKARSDKRARAGSVKRARDRRVAAGTQAEYQAKAAALAARRAPPVLSPELQALLFR